MRGGTAAAQDGEQNEEESEAVLEQGVECVSVAIHGMLRQAGPEVGHGCGHAHQRAQAGGGVRLARPQ